MTDTSDVGILLRDDVTPADKTTCDVDIQADLTCGFTSITCRELVNMLTTEQLDRELYYKHEHSVFVANASTDEKRQCLEKHLNPDLADTYDQQLAKIENLTDSLSCRVAESECVIAELNGKLKEASHTIQELLTPRTRTTSTEVPVHVTSLSTGTPPRIESGTSDNNMNFADFLDGTPFSDFSVDDLERSTQYDRTFSNRASAYYGPVEYTYSGAFHIPQGQANIQQPVLVRNLRTG